MRSVTSLVILFCRAALNSLDALKLTLISGDTAGIESTVPEGHGCEFGTVTGEGGTLGTGSGIDARNLLSFGAVNPASTQITKTAKRKPSIPGKTCFIAG